MRVRDPIHGTIWVSEAEKAVIDHRFYQRLRHVKQLGFGDLAFPGATHTRHAHSLGAMHVASRLFEAIDAPRRLSREVSARFRSAVRLAALCHDLGHMPLSHSSERIAPPRVALALPSWTKGESGSDQATHEDFTVKILLGSTLTDVIRQHFGPMGLSPEAIVSLMTGASHPDASAFVFDGVDWSPLLRALISGELDADRMDYLIRDSFFTGVHYGRFDLDWIVQNLNAGEREGRAYLALSKSAVFAFEDFLLSRYHMFVSVYYHHTAVNFDHMLRRYYEEAVGEFEIPADPESFLDCDDVLLALTLRRSKNRWAQRIVAREGYKLLAQFTERDEGYDLGALSRALTQSNIDHFAVESRGVLSKYSSEAHSPSLYILDVTSQRLTAVDRYTPLYQRYSGALRLSRLYVRPEQATVAQPIVAQLTRKEGV